ncbi:YCII-related domain protein [Clostridium puniceum]|uniref:YCII-related domain protein n=1 Tax=Clostridium puniceum TaxID=29367 RepID=A0A1S8TIF1_9CLOT|nr:YciI family protein [Clostridium puniceum]OOM77379.1 YCII-related domain protein [Clostridium puniceum]
MFIVNLTYVKPLEEVEKYLAEHIIFLNKYYARNNFVCSGRKNPRTGGVILCNAKNIEEVKKIISEDPFNRNSIANYEVVEFQPTKYAENFKEFVE